MKRVYLLPFAVGAIACQNATAPSSPSINVTVRDDAGATVASMPVRVMFDSQPRVDARTRSDGTVTIRVAGAGVYQVWVVPRTGYVGSTAGLQKIVSIDANENANVEFTVYRQGTSTADPPWDGFPAGG